MGVGVGVDLGESESRIIKLGLLRPELEIESVRFGDKVGFLSEKMNYYKLNDLEKKLSQRDFYLRI